MIRMRTGAGQKGPSPRLGHGQPSLFEARLSADRVRALVVLRALVDTTKRPIFFPVVPLMKPQTVFACQPVMYISSLKVTPPG